MAERSCIRLPGARLLATRHMSDTDHKLFNPAKVQYELVTTNERLAELCRDWQEKPYLAMDTEFIRTTTFYPHVGLIQINSGGQTNYLVDPLPISGWQAFQTLMRNPAITKVFHSCSEDLQVFMAAMDVVPAPVFDTQIAASLLNQGFGISYQNLVNARLGIELPKGETRSDWLQRPLTETQCQYAALDVDCLPEIYLAQREALVQQGRLSWLEEDCDTLLQQYRQEMLGDFSTFYQNIKGAWQLNRRQLAILRELANWRELRARKRDKPRNWIIRDRNLIDIARRMPERIEQIAGMEGIGKQFLRFEAPELLALVSDAAAIPESQYPGALPRPLDGSAKIQLKRGQQFVEEQAAKLNLPVEVLARKRWLVNILQAMPLEGEADERLPVGLTGWRKPILLPGLLEAMS